jgi:hypothetical protein
MAHRLAKAPPSLADRQSHVVKSWGFYAFQDSLQKAPSLRTIDLAAAVLAWPSLAKDGRSLYSDPGHLSDHGAMQLAPLFTDEISRLK